MLGAITQTADTQTFGHFECQIRNGLAQLTCLGLGSDKDWFIWIIQQQMKHEAVVGLLCFNALIEPQWLLVDRGSPHWFVGREENLCYMSFVAKLPARWLAKWFQFWGPIDLVPDQKFTVCHGPFSSIMFMAIFDRKFITREGTHFWSRSQKTSNSEIFRHSNNDSNSHLRCLLHSILRLRFLRTLQPTWWKRFFLGPGDGNWKFQGSQRWSYYWTCAFWGSMATLGCVCVCHKWMGILYILYISLYIMLYNYIYTQYNWHKITITYVY